MPDKIDDCPRCGETLRGYTMHCLIACWTCEWTIDKVAWLEAWGPSGPEPAEPVTPVTHRQAMSDESNTNTHDAKYNCWKIDYPIWISKRCPCAECAKE